ncbi:MAG: class II fructose-bisphosphate aldolase [Lachnospiraceae bacterium]|nr:class II fructose-bisphosphate aldolase [Lachnospiraceae bacterium]
MIYPMSELMIKAKKEGYGIAAPCVFSLDTVEACFEVADEMKAPVIVQAAPSRDLEEVGNMFKFLERRYPNAVVATNLDHGRDFESCVRAIRYGYSSVMIDRSEKPFEENVRETAELVKFAHACGVCVEAELGHVGQAFQYQETRDSGLTHKDEAEEFVRRTGVDCLAVAVGTSHGIYKGEPKIDYELLGELAEMLTIPLVLHGGSNTGDDLLLRAVKTGIQKINLATDLNLAGAKRMQEYVAANQNPKPGDKPVDIPGSEKAMKAGYKEMLMHYVKVFGSEGKA